MIVGLRGQSAREKPPRPASRALNINMTLFPQLSQEPLDTAFGEGRQDLAEFGQRGATGPVVGEMLQQEGLVGFVIEAFAAGISPRLSDGGVKLPGKKVTRPCAPPMPLHGTQFGEAGEARCQLGTEGLGQVALDRIERTTLVAQEAELVGGLLLLPVELTIFVGTGCKNARLDALGGAG